MAESNQSLQLAHILSDLTSLRVCTPDAALALVSARPNSTETTKTSDDEDADLTRATELVKLHYEVKEKHKYGELSRGLEEARREVARAVGS